MESNRSSHRQIHENKEFELDEAISGSTFEQPQNGYKTNETFTLNNGMTAKQEKFGIIKNLIIICVAFMLVFTAFQSMSALQSSINKVDGLGTWSNVAVYAALITSSIFLPSYVIKLFTVKWTLPLCMLC